MRKIDKIENEEEESRQQGKGLEGKGREEKRIEVVTNLNSKLIDCSIRTHYRPSALSL